MDLADAVTLFKACGYESAQVAIELLAHSYPPHLLLPHHKYVAHEVAQRAVKADPATKEILEVSPPARAQERDFPFERGQGLGL